MVNVVSNRMLLLKVRDGSHLTHPSCRFGEVSVAGAVLGAKVVAVQHQHGPSRTSGLDELASSYGANRNERTCTSAKLQARDTRNPPQPVRRRTAVAHSSGDCGGRDDRTLRTGPALLLQVGGLRLAWYEL